jgi:hypothetical protein
MAVLNWDLDKESEMDKNWSDILAEVVAQVIIGLVDGAIILWSWNGVLASLFHGPNITYGQALLIWLLADIFLSRARTTSIKIKES